MCLTNDEIFSKCDFIVEKIITVQLHGWSYVDDMACRLRLGPMKRKRQGPSSSVSMLMPWATQMATTRNTGTRLRATPSCRCGSKTFHVKPPCA